RRLVERARTEHEGRNCELSLRDIALIRRAVAATSRLISSDFRDPVESLDRLELRCRIEAGGRAARRGDGRRAIGFPDPAEPVRLDGAASSDPKLLYLVSRALEADARPDEARQHYHAA